MKAVRKPRLSLLLVSLLLALTGCATHMEKPAQAEAVRQRDLAGLPYHPLVYHLDLSILAYQLYAQTLAWPFDPYYEKLNNADWDRAKFMKKVHAWTAAQGAELSGYRGPGVLGGFDDNANHDPIVYRYDRLYPWSHTLNHSGSRWIEYLTPNEITGQIRDVYMCSRKTGGLEGAVDITHAVSGPNAAAPGARDVLLAFEGGTGDKGEPDRPASQSLMGFVLLRYWPGGDDYDVHIAFRGSRSGSAARAAWQALSDEKAYGNPDWVTNLGWNPAPPADRAYITTTGNVSRGFAKSMKSILPQLAGCLNQAARLAPGGPQRIYVTGHSLGGGLAQHFVSAVLLGNRYGPDGAGAMMPEPVARWPWKQIKLITFSAPRAGDKAWAKMLTENGLDSVFFSTAIVPIDRKALAVHAPAILPRLSARDGPAAYRVLISTDPVTTEKLPGGKHVGKTVYVNEPGMFASIYATPSAKAHELANIRALMLKSLADPRIPPVAWRYRSMQTVNPGREAAQRGSLEEYVKLADALERYYRENDLWFDHAAFARDFEIFKTILQAD